MGASPCSVSLLCLPALSLSPCSATNSLRSLLSCLPLYCCLYLCPPARSALPLLLPLLLLLTARTSHCLYYSLNCRLVHYIALPFTHCHTHSISLSVCLLTSLIHALCSGRRHDEGSAVLSLLASLSETGMVREESCAVLVDIYCPYLAPTTDSHCAYAACTN